MLLRIEISDIEFVFSKFSDLSFFAKMSSSKLTMGKDAVVSCLTQFLHPSQTIRDAFPNRQRGHRLEGLKVRRQEEKKINRKVQLAIVMVHDDFKNGDDYIELHAVARYCKITTQGPEDLYFTATPVEENETAEEVEVDPAVVEQVLTGRISDTTELQHHFTVDNDNDPAPENIPNIEDIGAPSVFTDWCEPSVCYRKAADMSNTKPRLLNVMRDINPTKVQLFELLFPKKFLTDILLPNINKKVTPSVNYGELLRWLGMWFLMATIQGPRRRDFWSTSNPDRFVGAPFRLNDIMSRNRFETILESLRYTDVPTPNYADRFHEVRQLIEMWNANMTDNFLPGWISCLDESMSVWNNKYTCPGFMVVPRKPWPFGNEYHTIACAVSNVLFQVELVEGKDEPRERGQKQFDDLGKTVGLLLRLTKPLWSAGKVVVLDSGFCVLKGIVELKKKGVFAAALIKKRRYWPKHIDGDAIARKFCGREIGDTLAWKGRLDGVDFHVFCMKEPDYVMSLMSSYGTCGRHGDDKNREYTQNRRKRRKTFKYPEVVHNHYQYRHVVDDHNARRHSPISLEATWGTSWWPNRVFAFLLAVTEVNVHLAEGYFYNKTNQSMLDFRKDLAKALINNDYFRPQESVENRRRELRNSHELMTLSRFRKFSGTRVVKSKSAYPQASCSQCHRKIRTYCRCSPGTMLCRNCHTGHVVEVETNVQR